MTATLTRSRTNKTAAEIEIERLGFNYHLDPEFDLSRLHHERRVQSRAPGHFAPKEQVERYAAQMGETVFPPIIVTGDDWIVDGNTRVGARAKRRDGLTAAYVLELDYANGTEEQRREVYALAVTMNQMNGNPLDPNEARTAAVELLKLGWRAEQISRSTGLPVSTVNRVRRETDAKNRLVRVGLSGDKKPTSVLNALAGQDVMTLNDRPYRELAQFAFDAGLGSREITALGRQAKATGSDDAGVRLIELEREEQADRIRQYSLTGNGNPPVARQLRQHIGFVNKYVDRESELVELDTSLIPKQIEALDTAIDVLTEARRLQVEAAPQAQEATVPS